jgi:hypothetical protein
MAGRLRTEPRRGDQQEADADPVDGARLPNHSQQIPRPLRLDTRPREHAQFGNSAVPDGDKDRQRTRDLKR